MNTTSDQPRPLTALESEVVTKLLSVGGVDAEELRAQIPHSHVVATWGVGSPSVDLAVDPKSARPASAADGIYANAAVTDHNGSPVGEIILWIDNGWLSSIEYAWYTDERPRILPEPTQIEVLQPHRKPGTGLR
ncbi:hypothetical protein [Nocardia ignorata]|uniref:Uncharacterized protein n=1 Tax=Nocardia ignorata TaxID=145285 RepID=A0A4R6P680_NOCIG|nr:hypothetical protein [Nocardia ignorata]TDP31489.1 hypothetical protein DFR75_10894 [Nocardia ignorata]